MFQTSQIWSVDISADGNSIVAGTYSGLLHYFSVDSSTPILLFGVI